MVEVPIKRGMIAAASERCCSPTPPSSRCAASCASAAPRTSTPSSPTRAPNEPAVAGLARSRRRGGARVKLAIARRRRVPRAAWSTARCSRAPAGWARRGRRSTTSSESRLDQIAPVLEGLEHERGEQLPFRATTRPRRGARGRRLRLLRDPRRASSRAASSTSTVPLGDGVVGQETTGPGGICFALRTVPGDGRAGGGRRRARAARVVRQLHEPGRASSPRRSRRCSATAWSASATRRPGSAAASPPRSAATRASCGSTTSGSTTSAGCAACSTASATCCPACSPTTRRSTTFEEGRLFGAEWLRSLGMIPNEYLYFFYFASDTVGRDPRGRRVARRVPARASRRRFYAANGRRRTRRSPPGARRAASASAPTSPRRAPRPGCAGRARVGGRRRLRGPGARGRRGDHLQRAPRADPQHREPQQPAVPRRAGRRRGACVVGARRAASRSRSAPCPTTRGR